MEKKKLLESRCSPSYIHDMMSTLSKNNSVEKLAEIDEIGFRFLRLVPNWSVKQAIMVHLVESYQVKQRTFILDTDNIRLNTELIGKAYWRKYLWIWIYYHAITHEHVVGDPFPALDDSNLCHVAIKKRFDRQTTTELRNLVYSCPMATESDKMEFRRYFLLVILYFQWLQYGLLDNCLEHEPWLDAWTSERLEKKVQYILSEIIDSLHFLNQGRLLIRQGEGEDIKGQSPQATRRKPEKKHHRSVDERIWCRQGGAPSVERASRSSPKQSEEKNLPMSIDDDEENEPLAKRMCRLFNQGVDQQKPSADPIEGNLNQDNAPHETPVSRVPDAGTLSAVLVQHEEWEFDGKVS
ncbi:hypothetical protein AHAS_Ahas15G0272200 [Arachis hypogaea]